MASPLRMEMTIESEAFQRLLVQAAGAALSPEPGGYRVAGDGWACRIAVARIAPLNLCRLRLERLAIELSLEGDPGPGQAFLARFKALGQRGGG